MIYHLMRGRSILMQIRHDKTDDGAAEGLIAMQAQSRARMRSARAAVSGTLALALTATAAQADLQLSFPRCKPISLYRIEIPDETRLATLPQQQQQHVRTYLKGRTAETAWPVFLLQPRPEMTDLTFVLEEKECASVCRGHAYTGAGRRIREVPFHYKKNFADHVRLAHDVDLRKHPLNSGFLSVAFYFLDPSSDQVRYFERSGYRKRVRGDSLVDQDPSWSRFFASSRLRMGRIKEPYWARVARKCVAHDHENEGLDPPTGALQIYGERGYPFTTLRNYLND